MRLILSENQFKDITNEDITAGILCICPKTKKMLLGLRSDKGSTPHVWCTFGGHLEPGEFPKEGALRELCEETQYKGNIKLHPSLVSRRRGKTHYNFLGTIENEFQCQLNDEHDDFGWFSMDEIEKMWEQLHRGVKMLFKKEREAIENLLNG